MSAEHIIQNNTFLSLAAGISVSDTTLTVTTGQGIRLDAVASPSFIFATLVRAATGELERIKITAHTASANSFTATRAADGTTALTFTAGDRIELRAGRSDWQQVPRLGLTENAVTAGGTADAITGTLALTDLVSLPDKFLVTVVGASANQVNNPTFNLTLNASATAAKTIVKGNQLVLAGGDMPPVAMLMYRTGTNNWTLLNPFYGALQAGDYVDSGNPTLTRTGFLLPDGSAVSRTTYAALLTGLTKFATFTITIAAPGVVTWNAHGIPENGEVTLATTGALPTGIGASIKYFVKNVTTNTFELSATPGGTSITTSGTQSGVHTGTFYPHGAGDGSVTFNTPDRNGRSRKGQGAGSFAISVDAAQVSAGTDAFTIPSNTDSIVTGMQGQFTTTTTLPTGLALATNYWLVRASATTFKVATSLANAQNGIVIDITAAGTGVHTFTQTLSTRTVGQKGGEEAHAMSSTELLATTVTGGSHTHTYTSPNLTQASVGAGGVISTQTLGATTGASGSLTMNPFGGNVAMNNESPYGVDTFWIKT